MLNHFARLFFNPCRSAPRANQRRHAVNFEHLALHHLLVQNVPSFEPHPAFFAVRQYCFVRHPSIIEEDMRIALVLSAGGMFGAYQLGAWEVLEQIFTPDIVVGTSIGSLTAWAIAGGATAAQLASLWYDPSLEHAIRWQIPRGFREGLLDTSALEQRIQQLHGAFTPQRPIGVVASAYPGLRHHLFRNQEITWQHLAASCAVPLFLRQPQIDGRTFADGGLFDSVNVWAAIELGATHVVVVNCWKPKQPWLLDKSVGWVAARRRRQALQQPQTAAVGCGTRIVLIEPEEALGDLRTALYWQKANLDRWRELGKSDAISKKQIICDMF